MEERIAYAKNFWKMLCVPVHLPVRNCNIVGATLAVARKLGICFQIENRFLKLGDGKRRPYNQNISNIHKSREQKFF